MRKSFYLLLFVFFAFQTNAQLINVNPDSNGEPWVIGGWKNPSKAELSKITVLKFDKNFKTKALPIKLDNSDLKYFRPIFNQTDGCCAQASGIAYNFTYEMNRVRNTSANVTANQFPTHFTYNFLNDGSGSVGSWYFDGWNIIKANGCPTVELYGSIAKDTSYWMSGYADYEASMENKVIETFNIDVSNEQGLENLKYWMYNHGDGSADGGIVNFSAGISISGYNITHNNIIISWGSSVNHAMTFVGWDDKIGYDVNHDGRITNSIDITNDGVVDMKDWERGAMIMVNSWGESWGDNGKAYVLYRLLALPVAEGGIGSGNMVSSIKVRDEYTKKLVMRVAMNHSQRSKIKIVAGVSANTSANEPDYTVSFPLFNYQGGAYNMRGKNNTSDIELSLDITSLLNNINSNKDAKFFLQVYENDENADASGSITRFSVVNSDATEFISTQTNVNIINNDITTLSVVGSAEYDSPEISSSILPQAIQHHNYSTQLQANGGVAPYKWGVIHDFTEQNISKSYPYINSNKISFDDNDDGYGVQKIDFQFPFGDSSYNKIYVRTDGSLAFEAGFSYVRSTDAILAEKIISVFAYDLMIYPSAGDGVFYNGDENSATFRWKTSLYGQSSADIDVAVTIYPSGEIEFFYGNSIETGLDWASGISVGDGISYLIPNISGQSNPSNNMFKIEGNKLPSGMNISSHGEFFGKPKIDGNSNVNFYVIDFDGIRNSAILNFDVEASVDLFELTSDFKIYPNPANNFAIISVDLSNIDDVTIKISDLNGKTVYQKLYSNNLHGENKFNVDLTNLSSGVYFISLETVDYVKTKKLIIE